MSISQGRGNDLGHLAEDHRAKYQFEPRNRVQVALADACRSAGEIAIVERLLRARLS